MEKLFTYSDTELFDTLLRLAGKEGTTKTQAIVILLSAAVFYGPKPEIQKRLAELTDEETAPAVLYMMSELITVDKKITDPFQFVVTTLRTAGILLSEASAEESSKCLN